MNSISMNFHYLYCKIPHNNISSAHVNFDISLGKRQHCCDQSGAVYILPVNMCILFSKVAAIKLHL